jgi:acyl carrier protein
MTISPSPAKEPAHEASASQAMDAIRTRLDETALSKLRTWIESRKSLGVEIGEDVDLIGGGILDSLEMINFLLYIEEIRGHEIPESLTRPEHFSSLRAVCQAFFDK